ncbi:MAG: HAD family hydrolase [Solobacterium sp.]|nr:HAD family hydrolase [Solobacterium sp.]
MKAVLFDLDGTLLPMDNDVFTRVYFKHLARSAYAWGFTDSEAFIRAIWHGVAAMVGNDGSRTNMDAFCASFEKDTGCSIPDVLEHFSYFYEHEFHQAKEATSPAPLAKDLVKAAHEAADLVLLATNPLFPLNADETRMSWIGLKAEDFDYVTTYDNSCWCKPDPAYYTELLEKFSLQPEDCIMIGNDMDEDIIAAEKAGIKGWLLNDFLINRGNVEIHCPQGSYEEALAYVKSLRKQS